MEALSHSASLADLIEKRSAARWTGCSARDFAEAVVAKLEWLWVQVGERAGRVRGPFFKQYIV